MNTRIESSNKIFYRILSFLVVFAVLLYGFPQIANAAGGSYSISFYASDPSVNKGPYSPTYDKLTPHVQLPYTDGRGDNVLEHAVLYAPGAQSNDRDGVTSLEPADLALGQIVVFQVEISATGSTDSENGRIEFSAGWNTKSTSGSDFGFDPDYGVYSAFVDYGDPGSIDPDENATVEDYSYVIANEGTSNEEIQGNFVIAGLDQGDRAIVEIWMVLKDSLPDKATGNVQTRMIDANTLPVDGSPQTINVGNQTVPLKQLGSFTSIKTDITVTKSWEDSYNDQEDYFGLRPDSVEAQLQRNGQTYGDVFEIKASEGWEKTFTGLLLRDSSGSPYTYTAVEVNPHNSYLVSSDGLEIENALRRVDKEAEKIWEDFDDEFGYRPDSIRIELLRDGTATGMEADLTSANYWKHTFTGLPEKAADGHTYIYSVEEISETDRYTKSEVGMTVTNTLETGEITVNKLAGASTDLTDQTFYVKLTKADDATKSWVQAFAIDDPAVFENLPYGTYNIEEVADSLGTALPDNYRYDVTVSDESITVAPEALEASSDITNTLRRTEISGQKIWQDQDDNFGLRPDSITVYLYQNDDSEPIASMPVTAADADENDNNIWSFTFPDLPMFDENNEAYTYSVSEPFVSPDYEEPDIDGMGITNTLITTGIQLLKLSSGPETIPLADASFELWRALPQNEEQLLVFDIDLIPGTLIPGMRLETITTGDDGIAETEGSYPQGMYYLIETAAPFGYYPLTEPTQINLLSATIIQLEGAPFELTIYNDFIYEPDITILKTVANLTAGTAQSESAELLAGETAGYEVTVTNSGNATLDEVLLYDSEAYEGLIAVDQDGIEYTFANDSEDNAYILLGAMEPLQEFILNYEYVTVEADAEISPIINTATAEGIILPPQIDIASDQFYNPFPEGWFKSVSDSAEITVTLPPEETTTETTPEETTTETAPTIPLITVITETIPLAEPAITSPSMPTIQITEEEIPLATPETITLVTEEIPKSGENPPIWPIGLAMIIIAGGIALLIHKQDGDKTKYEDDL